MREKDDSITHSLLSITPMSHFGGSFSSAYLGVSAGPVVSSTSTVFGHVDVLVVVELGIG